MAISTRMDAYGSTFPRALPTHFISSRFNNAQPRAQKLANTDERAQ
jgi:hypothetical protein